MNGEFIGEGWKYGLIEVDLMPTLAERLFPSRDVVFPSDWLYGQEVDRPCWLGF